MPAAATQLLLSVAESLGARTAHLKRLCGFPLDGELDPDARIDAELHWQAWEAIVRDAPTAHLGLEIGRAFRPESLGIVGYGLMCCSTLREGLHFLARHARLIGETAPQVVVVGDRLTIRSVLRPRVARISGVADSVAMSVLRLIVAMTDSAPPVHRVRLQRPRPLSPCAYQAAFDGAPLTFDDCETAVVMDRAFLDAPVKGADTMLHRYLAREAEALLARMPRNGTLAEEVRRVIADQLHAGEPTTASIARTLGRSTRALQRGLRGEGTSLSELLDEARHELAELYLRDRDISIGEIAYLLGYSEPSAFHRAFRRWTGKTPQAFRCGHEALAGAAVVGCGRRPYAYPHVA